MIANLFTDFLLISLTTIPIIIAVILISRFLGNRYHVKWTYWIWLILAVRLLLPFNFPFPNDLFEINVPNVVPEMLVEENIFQEPALRVDEMELLPAQPVIAQGSTMPSFIEIITWSWLIVAVLFLLYHFMSYFLFRKEALRWSQVISNQNVVTKINQVFTEMNVRSTVPVLTSEKVPNPMLVGFVKPILFLPHEGYTEEELEFILKHELIHFQRNDILYKLLLLVVQAIHWFNPFVWLMVREASRDIEIYCDYAIVEQQGLTYRKKYCEAILSAMQDKKSRSLPLSTNFSSGKKLMKNRFMSILNTNHKKNGLIPFCIITLLIVASACTNLSGGQSSNQEASQVINEHLGISPYVPETDSELGAVILESYPGFEDQGPLFATVNYYEPPLDELTPPNEEIMEQFEEMFPEREVVYGTLYVEPAVITIEVYPDGFGGMGDDVENIEVAGHEIQYNFLQKGTDGRDSDNIFMVIDFDDVSYFIRYSVQSDQIEAEAKKLAEDIITNQS